jgi:hypothetical protein
VQPGKLIRKSFAPESVAAILLAGGEKGAHIIRVSTYADPPSFRHMGARMQVMHVALR